MGKLLSWIVIGSLGYLAYRLVQVLQRKALAQRTGVPPQAGRPGAPTPVVRELMRPCEVCGTYVPDGDALRSNGRFYCSAAHRDQAA